MKDYYQVRVECFAEVEVVLNGRYRLAGGKWKLHQWRVDSNFVGEPRREGNWYKIHGNQKRTIGQLPLFACPDFLNKHGVRPTE